MILIFLLKKKEIIDFLNADGFCVHKKFMM